MRFITSFKIFLVVIAVIMIAVFVNQNTHHVPIQFPFARPYQFRLILMLLISFTSGIILTLFSVMYINAKIAKKKRLEESEDLVEDEE